MRKKSFLTPLGLVRQYNSPKPYCSPSIIIQGTFHLSRSADFKIGCYDIFRHGCIYCKRFHLSDMTFNLTVSMEQCEMHHNFNQRLNGLCTVSSMNVYGRLKQRWWWWTECSGGPGLCAWDSYVNNFYQAYLPNRWSAVTIIHFWELILKIKCYFLGWFLCFQHMYIENFKWK